MAKHFNSKRKIKRSSLTQTRSVSFYCTVVAVITTRFPICKRGFAGRLGLPETINKVTASEPPCFFIQGKAPCWRTSRLTGCSLLFGGFALLELVSLTLRLLVGWQRLTLGAQRVADFATGSRVVATVRVTCWMSYVTIFASLFLEGSFSRN